MREKTQKLIVTFHTTTAAMAMERYCMANGVPGRLIPVPREITAGCGMAWCAPVSDRAAVERAIPLAGVKTDGCYELFV